MHFWEPFPKTEEFLHSKTSEWILKKKKRFTSLISSCFATKLPVVPCIRLEPNNKQLIPITIWFPLPLHLFKGCTVRWTHVKSFHHVPFLFGGSGIQAPKLTKENRFVSPPVVKSPLEGKTRLCWSDQSVSLNLTLKQHRLSVSERRSWTVITLLIVDHYSSHCSSGLLPLKKSFH